MIFYFSGTGNSQLIAKRIAKRTGRNLCRINDFLKRGEKLTIPDSIAKLEDIVFVMPVYGWRIPRAVEELIRRSALEEGTGVYLYSPAAAIWGIRSDMRRNCALI